MPCSLGLAMASKIYRQVDVLQEKNKFSSNGNEVAFGTIGNASTSEGHFWKAINAAGVLNVPMVMFVWDDDYGISVHKKYQTVKESISSAMGEFSLEDDTGFEIYQVKGWDYENMLKVFYEGIEKARNEHIPVLFHVVELTQPQGHSTSGSHERYKSEERLKWEEEHDGLKKMRQWILEQELATAEELDNIEKEAVNRAKEARKTAWKNFTEPLKKKRDELLNVVDISKCNCAQSVKSDQMKQEIKQTAHPIRKDLISYGKKMLRLVCDNCSDPRHSLRENVRQWVDKEQQEGYRVYNTHLYAENERSATKIEHVKPEYDNNSEAVLGREILRDNFDSIFENYTNALIFGEDVGKIGGVNQTVEGLQEKYGELRVADTGIREATIIGEGIGMAMRGLRPIAEIQYFDYLLYGLQVLSDDLDTLHYRTKGGKKHL